MLINFVNEGLTSEITSDKVCSYDYEVTNLISTEPASRKRGFLVDNFVKPPVRVTAKFVCDVDIKRVSVFARVGAQKSSGFEVFTARQGSGEASVGTGFLGLQDNVLEFRIYGENMGKCVSFKSSKYLNKIRSVTVKIFKTEGSTLPALSHLQIWGTVHRNVCPEMAQNVHAIWNKLIETKDPVKTLLARSGTKTILLPSNLKPTVVIPDEFLDPITCEMMTIPMALPSGNIVDALTIEKFAEAEKLHGRGQSDPYTGLLFTVQNKPLVVASLKARIDKFLIDNASIPELSTAPRALGKKPVIDDRPGTSQPKKNTSSQNDVDKLLSSSLSGLPTFLKEPVRKKAKNECTACSATECLFELGCHHILCRGCLLDFKAKKINACNVCMKEINFSNVNRFHSGKYF